MLQFFKDSIRELQHVVWPTRKETQKYFGLVLIVLVFFGLYLFLFSNMFSEILFSLKSTYSKDVYTSSSNISGEQVIPENVEMSIISDEAIVTEETMEDIKTQEEQDIQTGAIDQ